MKESKNFFDELYDKSEFYWGLNPSSLILDILKYKKNGSVLDLGCGEGRNVIFLAKNGFDVTGIDASKAGIRKLEKLASEFHLNIRTIISDINKFMFERGYDVILSIATLHFLERHDIERLIMDMKTHTRKGGLDVISVFTEENPHKRFPYLFRKKELEDFYKDWEVLQYDEYITPPEKHGSESWHRHGVASLIAKKMN